MDLDNSDYLHVSVCCINVGGLGCPILSILMFSSGPYALFRLFRLSFSKSPTTSFIEGSIGFKFSASFHNYVPWLSVIFNFTIFVMVLTAENHSLNI